MSKFTLVRGAVVVEILDVLVNQRRRHAVSDGAVFLPGKWGLEPKCIGGFMRSCGHV